MNSGEIESREQEVNNFLENICEIYFRTRPELKVDVSIKQNNEWVKMRSVYIDQTNVSTNNPSKEELKNMLSVKDAERVNEYLMDRIHELTIQYNNPYSPELIEFKIHRDALIQKEHEIYDILLYRKSIELTKRWICPGCKKDQCIYYDYDNVTQNVCDIPRLRWTEQHKINGTWTDVDRT